MATGDEWRLTDNDARDLNPFWSPDGTRVVFQSDRDGLWQIYELNLQTRQVTRLSDGHGQDVDPQYSPDGRTIAFRSYRDGDDSILYLMDSDGQGAQRITPLDGDATNHAWSPNGQYIAFQSDLDGDLDVYIYDVATGQIRLLTDNDIDDYAPTWRCDSVHVVFTSDVTGNPDIFEAEATPIQDPPTLVDTDAEQLTFELSQDVYPKQMPGEENASREGADPVVAGHLGEQTNFWEPDLTITLQDATLLDVDATQRPAINACPAP
jgi:Tol biopolymer transport system component